MTIVHDGNLGDKRYVTLVLRLVLDGQGGLEYGEMVDANTTLLERFTGTQGLLTSLRTRLTRMEQTGSPPAP